jgi:hypothetical protein
MARGSPAKSIFLQQINKKIVGQILSVLAAVAPPANERINRVTITVIQIFERIPALHAFAGSGGD